jgi:heme o synthase
VKTTAITASRLLLPSWPRLTARLPAFITLMKPRVMLLVVFTASVALMIAPGHLDPLLGYVAIVAIAAGAGAAGVLNMWYDADIDAAMSRVRRPIPHRKISRSEALMFGLVLACSAVAVLPIATKVRPTALLALAIFFYIVVYAMWIKRHTPQNIVIGGAVGALPPVIGWRSHFRALLLNRGVEYARASVPMLPVVAARATTTRQILVYSIAVVSISVLPWVLGFVGRLYGVTAVVCGALLVVLACQLDQASKVDRKAAHRLFAFSIAHLFLLFAALLISSGGNQGFSARTAWTCSEPAEADWSSSFIRAARSSNTVPEDEA